MAASCPVKQGDHWEFVETGDIPFKNRLTEAVMLCKSVDEMDTLVPDSHILWPISVHPGVMLSKSDDDMNTLLTSTIC